MPGLLAPPPPATSPPSASSPPAGCRQRRTETARPGPDAHIRRPNAAMPADDRGARARRRSVADGRCGVGAMPAAQASRWTLHDPCAAPWRRPRETAACRARASAPRPASAAIATHPARSRSSIGPVAWPTRGPCHRCRRLRVRIGIAGARQTHRHVNRRQRQPGEGPRAAGRRGPGAAPRQGRVPARGR